MHITNTKSAVAKKKTAPKKKVEVSEKKKPPSRLHEFPEDIQKKARKFAADLAKNQVWKLRGFKNNGLERLPRGKDTIRVKKQTLDDLGGYDSDGGHIAAFIKRLYKFVEAAQAKGATDLRISYRRVVLVANRKETDAEFQNRYDDVTIQRAYTLAVREVIAERDKKQKVEEKERVKLDELKDFHASVKRLGCDRAQKIIDGIRKTGKK